MRAVRFRKICLEFCVYAAARQMGLLSGLVPHPYAAQERLEEPSLLMARARSKQQILRAQI